MTLDEKSAYTHKIKEDIFVVASDLACGWQSWNTGGGGTLFTQQEETHQAFKENKTFPYQTLAKVPI